MAAVIDRMTSNVMNAPMSMVHTCYSKILCGVGRDVRERVWKEDELRIPDERIKGF